MHERLTNFFVMLLLPLRPAFWRWIFLRRAKVRVFLRSGEHVDLLCSEWNLNYKNGQCVSYEFDGLFANVSFTPGDIIAIKQM